jgi:plastocyanin
MSATYDGTQFINLVPEEGEGEEGEEAPPPPPFTITFSRAGTFPYFCAFHPGMRGEITVAPAGAALPETPAQAQARGQAELQATLAALKAQVAMVAPAPQTTVEAPGRSTTHAALVGLGSGFSASYMNFLPGTLMVRRGDLVVWTMPDPFEIHTVTYTAGAEPPPFAEPAIGPEGPPMGPPTLVIPANVAGRVGGDTFTGSAYVNSGLLFGGQSYTIRVDAPAGDYEFLCLIHPFMTVTLSVVEP